MKKRLGEESVVSLSPSTTFANLVYREMALVSQLRKVRAKIYHATSEFGLRALLIAHKRPIVVSIHDLIPLYFLRRAPLRYANQLLHLQNTRFANEIVVSSRFYCNLLADTFRISSKKMTPVHYGVDHSTFKPFNERSLNLEIRVLFLGGLNPLKGAADLIGAFGAFSIANRSSLIVAGKGKGAMSFKALAQNKKIADRTEFPGFVKENELPSLYNSVDVLVWPSYFGFGLPTLEAMACGTPVIANDCFDSPEYVRGGAMIYKTKDVQQLSDRLSSLVLSADNWKMWSERALNWSKNYSWDKMFDGVMSVYGNLGSH